MNDAFEKKLREALASRQYEVDPAHRAAMEDLLHKQDRRRPFVIWWAGAGLAGLVLLAGLLLMRRPASTSSTGHASPMPITSVDEVKEKQGANTLGSDAASPLAMNEEDIIASDVKEARSSAGDRKDEPQTNSTARTHRKYTAKPEASEESGRSGTNRTGTPRDASPGLAQAAVEPRPVEGPLSSGEPVMNAHRETAFDPMVPPVASDEKLSGEPGMAFPEQIPAEISDEAPRMLDRELITVADLGSIAVAPLPLDGPPGEMHIEPVSGKPWYLFAETSGGLIGGKGATYPGGWNAAAGAGIGFSLAPRLEAVVSAGYWVQDGGFSFLRESTVREAGFGIRSAFHRLMPERMHHAYVRAGIQYRLRRHFVSARAGLLYLYGAEGDIAVQAYDQITGQTAEKASAAWLSTDGLRRWKAQGELHYGYQLAPRFALSAGVLWRPGGIMREDPALASEGFSWKGQAANWQSLLSLQYRIYGNR